MDLLTLLMLVVDSLTAVHVLKDRIRSGRSLRVFTEEVAGRITVRHGFPQNSLQVTVANRGDANAEIREMRLMFSRKFGVPLGEAPPPRSHSELPAMIEPGTAGTWFFPAETVAQTLQGWSPKFPSSPSETLLRARVTTSTGDVYWSRRRRFSLDVNAHW